MMWPLNCKLERWRPAQPIGACLPLDLTRSGSTPQSCSAADLYTDSGQKIKAPRIQRPGDGVWGRHQAWAHEQTLSMGTHGLTLSVLKEVQQQEGDPEQKPPS